MLADRDELLQLLTEQASDPQTSQSQQQKQQRLSQLVDALAGAGGRFEERLLGGGPWVVRQQASSQDPRTLLPLEPSPQPIRCLRYVCAVLCAGAVHKGPAGTVEGDL